MTASAASSCGILRAQQKSPESQGPIPDAITRPKAFCDPIPTK